MSLSYTTYTGDGVTTLFSIPFPYLDSSDVTVLVNGLPVTFTFPTAQTIQLGTAPGVGVAVKVQRITDIAVPIVDFVDGSNITERELDLSTQQPLFGLQEVYDDLQFWKAFIQNQAISATDLPPVGPGQDNSFVVANSSTWIVRSLAEVKQILGIGDVTAGYTTIPDPAGLAAFIYTDGTTFQLLPPDACLTALGLGDLAVHNESDYPNLVRGTTVDTGNFVLFDDVGGSPGLPVCDGSQLTGISKEKYVRVEDRKSQGTNGGAYAAARTWVQRDLQSKTVDEVGSPVAVSGNYFTLPAGKYRIHARTRFYIDGHASIRIVADTGTILTRGEEFYSTGAQDQWVHLKFQDTFNGTVNLRVDFFSTGSYNDPKALGKAANDSELSPEVYTIVEIWKLP
jgi:hypothetical protein